jgi:hypothetical protein
MGAFPAVDFPLPIRQGDKSRCGPAARTAAPKGDCRHIQIARAEELRIADYLLAKTARVRIRIIVFDQQGYPAPIR